MANEEITRATGTVFNTIHPKYKAFADEWLTGEHTGKRFNGRAAYEHAGYTAAPSNPSTNASKLLRHPDVAAYIKSRMDEMAMSTDEVLLRFSDIARSNVGNILTKNELFQRVEIDHDALLANKHYVKSFGYDANGNMKVEFHDPQRALENVARVLDMFKGEFGFNGSAGAPITMRVQFVSPEGEIEEHGPTSEHQDAIEDFSELDEMTLGLPGDED